MRSAQRASVGIGLALLLGYFSIAIAFGVSGRALGFGAIAVASFSVFVFAGASQFLAISLLAQGAAVIPVILATFVLNSRHMVMSMALRDRIDYASIPRPVLAFGITDEVFTAAATRFDRVPDRDLLTLELFAYAGWVSGTLVGYLIGSVLPELFERAMGVALYAMFVALIVPPILRFPRYLVPALVAGGVNWALQAIGVPVGFSLLAAIALVAVLFSIRPEWSEP